VLAARIARDRVIARRLRMVCMIVFVRYEEKQSKVC